MRSASARRPAHLRSARCGPAPRARRAARRPPTRHTPARSPRRPRSDWTVRGGGDVEPRGDRRRDQRHDGAHADPGTSGDRADGQLSDVRRAEVAARPASAPAPAGTERAPRRRSRCSAGTTVSSRSSRNARYRRRIETRLDRRPHGGRAAGSAGSGDRASSSGRTAGTRPGTATSAASSSRAGTVNTSTGANTSPRTGPRHSASNRLTRPRSPGNGTERASARGDGHRRLGCRPSIRWSAAPRRRGPQPLRRRESPRARVAESGRTPCRLFERDENSSHVRHVAARGGQGEALRDGRSGRTHPRPDHRHPQWPTRRRADQPRRARVSRGNPRPALRSHRAGRDPCRRKPRSSPETWSPATSCTLDTRHVDRAPRTATTCVSPDRPCDNSTPCPARLRRSRRVHARPPHGRAPPGRRATTSRARRTPSGRRGAYSVIYEVDDDNKVVNVVRIDHRATAYRPR